MNRILSLLVLIFFPITAISQQITPEMAEQTAIQFRLSSSDKTQKAPIRSEGSVSLSYTATTGFNNDFYVYNYPDNNGFVIVSADSRTRNKILAYSFQGSFNPESIPDNAAYILESYQKQIESIRNSNAPTRPSVDAPATPNVVVEPLIKTKWDQGDPYNGMCPRDPDNDKRTYTGCVATSLAQVLNYWKWPQRGHGSHHNTSDTTLFVNFDESEYDWDNTLTRYYSNSNSSLIEGIQKIMYDCGTAVNMQYGTTGSSAFTAAQPKALYTYFDYKTTAKLVSYFDIQNQENPDSVWMSLLRKELDAGRPVLYSGTDQSDNMGHSFICDGYDDQNYFHFNLGWSGNLDAYYIPTSVELNDGSGCYDSYFEMVIGIEPDKNDGYNDGYTFCSLMDNQYGILEGMITPYENLGILTIPENVTINNQQYPVYIIDHYSFEYTYSATGIKFPSNVYQLGYWAFQECPNLTSVEIPASIIYFGAGCFASCNNLKKITVNSNNSYFYSPKNSNAVIETENKRLVQGCNYTTIPSEVQIIGENAFQGFDGIKQITFPNNLKSIEDDAFYDCTNLKSIYLNANIQTIGLRVFDRCTSLTDVYCFSIQPPQIDVTTFPSGITVHVKSDAASSYRTHPVWSLFDIEDDLTDSVEQIVMPDDENTKHHYYDIIGRRADSNSRLQIREGRKYFFK